MSTYVVGDIHGNLEKWESLKNQIGFTNDDHIIFIGDIIDRGNDGVKILQEIISNPKMHLILGNHEFMMLNNWNLGKYQEKDRHLIREEWMINGGYPTVQAMSALPNAEQEKIISYLRSKTKLKLKTTTPDGRMFYICHGWVDGDPDHDSDIFHVVWDRPERNSNPDLYIYTGNDIQATLIVGHTPVINLLTTQEYTDARNHHTKILHAPHFIDIDCGCGHTGDYFRLACLRLEDMAEFYA